MELYADPRAGLLTFVPILPVIYLIPFREVIMLSAGKRPLYYKKLLVNAAFRGGLMAARFFPLDQSDPVEIAGYVLRARIGSGGMGNVYLSFTRGGRPVALKVVRKEFADDPEFRRRFRMEVTAAQRVQGLYTAPVVDADTDATVPWLATAYIAGPSLNYAVGEYGRLPEASVFRLLGGVAEGLTAVHAAGLVHRDLKPANVLLAADGPRVIDFGIAFATDATSLTNSGALLGTPAFMTPEQVAGKPVSSATDVFALGHLVAYAATGHSVFGDGHFSSLVYRIAQEQPDLSGCPDSLRECVSRCLAKDPAERPDLAEIMVLAKDGLAGQTMQLANGSWLPEPVAGTLAAYDTSAAPPAAARLPDATVTVGTGSGPVSSGSVTVPGAGGPGGYGLPPAAPQPSGPVPPPRRRRGLKRPGVIVPAVLVVLLAAVGAGAYLGFDLKGNSSAQNQAGSDTAPTVSASAQAVSTPAAAGSTSAPASVPGAAVPSSAVSGAVVSSTEYSTPDPFPLCDPNGGQWLLVNMTPQSGGCVPNMQAVSNNSGYSFATVSSFPHGVPLTDSNTVTVSGQVGGYNGTNCLGPAEGNTSSGYIALLCDNGQWYIDSVASLGTSSAVVGKQLATGSYPYSQSTTYDISLTFGSGTGKLGVTFSQGSASPLSETFSTGAFTPDSVGYALNTGGGNESSTIDGFVYTVN
jgi:Protein kinase domain